MHIILCSRSCVTVLFHLFCVCTLHHLLCICTWHLSSLKLVMLHFYISNFLHNFPVKLNVFDSPCIFFVASSLLLLFSSRCPCLFFCVSYVTFLTSLFSPSFISITFLPFIFFCLQPLHCFSSFRAHLASTSSSLKIHHVTVCTP